MKFTPKVIAALQVLRDNAVNDFERHRIDVLERDLTAPPQVEVIDSKHQRFNGVTYCQTSTKHYSGRPTIHRAIWFYYYGEIPNGYHIHHIDGNPANNGIENLQCLTVADHAAAHHAMKMVTVCKNCGVKFETNSFRPKHFCSEECKHQHTQSLQMETRICAVCGKTFSCRKSLNQTTCSNKCAWQIRPAPSKITATCEVCGKEFTTIRRGVRYCSQKCRVHAKYERDKVKRICPVCGKEFMSPKNPLSTCCSMSCSHKYRRHPKSVLK